MSRSTYKLLVEKMWSDGRIVEDELAALDQYQDARPEGLPWPTNNRGARNEPTKPKKG